MIALLCFFLSLFASPFKSRSRLEAENAAPSNTPQTFEPLNSSASRIGNRRQTDADGLAFLARSWMHSLPLGGDRAGMQSMGARICRQRRTTDGRVARGLTGKSYHMRGFKWAAH